MEIYTNWRGWATREELEHACRLMGFPTARLPDDRPPIFQTTSAGHEFLRVAQAASTSLAQIIVLLKRDPSHALAIRSALLLGGKESGYDYIRALLVR